MLSVTLLSTLLLATPQLKTVAELSAWRKSGTYAEVQEFCRALPERFPGRVRCDTFGTTPEGRPMLAMVLGTGSKVVLAQGGIHAGEIDGKDAGLALVRDLLDGSVSRGTLDAITFVFVPVFNVDGHENAAPFNRPNQLGPETPGFRVTAQRLNLNRDYVKADAPEMRAMLTLLRKWDPLVYIDLHTTDGMDFQYDVSVMVEPRFGGNKEMRAAGDALSASALAKLKTLRHLPLDFYPTAQDEMNPLSGWSNGVSPPRFSHGYWPMFDRYAVLVETHALKSNAERIRASRDALIAIMESVRDSDLPTPKRAFAGAQLELSYEASGEPAMLDFAGVAYESKPSVITGKTWVRFDPKKKAQWKTPFVAGVAPKLVVTAPKGGYVVAPAWASTVLPVLTAHGITSKLVHASKTKREVFKASKAAVSARTSEGRTRVSVEGEWQRDEGAILDGSLFVPVDQRAGELVVQLFEPKAPDSFVAWGFMNTVFEAREYVELMFLEPFARDLMEKQPSVKADFEKLVASGAGEDARIDFFYRLHPSHDRQREVYPVVRIDTTL